jgi:hypothetical protein
MVMTNVVRRLSRGLLYGLIAACLGVVAGLMVATLVLMASTVAFSNATSVHTGAGGEWLLRLLAIGFGAVGLVLGGYMGLVPASAIKVAPQAKPEPS